MYLGKKEILNLTELEKITRKLGVYWELELDDLQVRKDFLYRDYADATSLEQYKAIPQGSASRCADSEVYKEIELFGYFFDNSVTDITQIQQTLAVYDPEDYSDLDPNYFEYDPNYIRDPNEPPATF